MQNFRLFTVCILLLAAPASAADKNVFEYKPNLTVTKVARPLKVKHSFFELVCPAGWSMNTATSDGGSVTSSITLTPTADTVTDEVYWGIHQRVEQMKRTLAEFRQMQQENYHRKAEFRQINGTRWVWVEYKAPNIYKGGRTGDCFLGVAKKKYKEFWVTACTPEPISTEHRAKFYEILDSVKFL